MQNKLITRQLITNIMSQFNLLAIQFGFVKIGAAPQPPAAATADWHFKYNPHYHLKGAQSAIVFLYPYQLVSVDAAAGRAKLASIGYHADYHVALTHYLEAVAAGLKNNLGDFDYKIFVDKDGLDDVKMALQAGLGKIAKNSMLINAQYGTAHNIGYILTTLPVAVQAQQPVADLCINCNRCEVACPNNALANRSVKRVRCRSSLNQKKGALSEREIGLIGNWFYGCDICQYACPHNITQAVSGGAIDLAEIMQLTKKTFRERHKAQSYGYLGLTRLKRNAMVLLAKQLGLTALQPYQAIIARSPLLSEQYQILVNREKSGG